MKDGLSIDEIRRDFPLLERRIEERPVVYLDSAATSLKPRSVVDAMVDYYTRTTANVHRGKHTLSEEASEAFEEARRKVARFLGARPREIAFTSGTTAAMNLVALGLPLRPGCNVVTTRQEHHSTLTPWFGRAEVRVVPVLEDGRADPAAILALVDERTAVVAMSAASNATGAVHDVRAVADGLAGSDVRLVVDGAQSAPHLPTDVWALGCDFFALSGHKMLGPTGIGVLWGKPERLAELSTALRGGGMVDLVTEEGFTPKAVPFRFEAGTPHIAGAIGLGAAVDYLERVGMERIAAHEALLAERLVRGLSSLPGTTLLGPALGGPRLAIASLVVRSKAVAPDHVAMILSDTRKIMVRSGHHCCHPYFDALGVKGSLRLSAYLYNTAEEIDAAVDAVKEVLAGIHA